MTGPIPVILTLALICTESLSAQIVPWYLRGKEEAKPVTADKLVENPVSQEEEIRTRPLEPAPEDSSAAGEGNVEITLLMPFRQDSVENTSVLDFYSGALLAVRDLGNKGMTVRLSAEDCNGRIPPRKESEVIIGPFSRSGIRNTLASVAPHSTVVSALDAEPDNDRTPASLLQIPTFQASRNASLVEWFAGRAGEGRHLIVLSEKGKEDEFASDIQMRLNAKGTLVIQTSDTTSIAGRFTEGDRLSILIASESERYVEESIRAVSALVMRRFDIETFCSAKVRNYETLNVDFLHNCNVHLCTNYHTDYSRDEVKGFVRTYRALFDCEPDRFAFHGYDVVKYVSEAISKYGHDWLGMLDKMPAEGLQTAFAFKADETTGRMRNTASIKIEYCRDYSVRTH